MHVHDIRVSFTREKQPREYEKSAPSIELSASLSEDEDPIAACRELMTTACTTVYNALGMGVPEAIAAKLADGEIPDGGTAKKETAKKTAAKKTTTKKTAAKKSADSGDAGDELPDDGEDDKAKKDTAKKTESKKAASDDELPDDGEDDKAKKTDSKKAAADDELPDDDDGDKSEASGGDELPDDGDSGSEESGGDDGEEMSAEDLQSFITKQVSDKKINVADVKKILSDHGASRTSDIPADERGEVKKKIEDASK